MKDQIKIIIQGAVTAKQRPKASRIGGFIRVYTPTKTANYENYVKLCYQDQIGEMFAEEGVPLACDIHIYKLVPKSLSKKKTIAALNGQILPTHKPDLDNCVKSVLDALNKVAYHDDGQIVSLYIDKTYSEEEKVEVVLTKVNNKEEVKQSIRGFLNEKQANEESTIQE